MSYFILLLCLAASAVAKPVDLVLELPDFVKAQEGDELYEPPPVLEQEEDKPGQPLGDVDYMSAAYVDDKYMEPPAEYEPLELAGMFEGDILGPNKIGKNAIRDDQRRWPNATIPYVISSDFGQKTRSMIARAILQFHELTCVRFVPREKQEDYIYIMRGQGCYAYPGVMKGKQEVSIGRGCEYVGIIIHELMHSTGFYHEQSRADRDDYVDIKWDNIRPNAQNQFAKYTLKDIQHLNETYDYNSIMHYGPRAFSKDRKKLVTIVAKKGEGTRMGQRRGFSEIDLRKINKFYECSARSDDIDGDEIDAHTCEDKHVYCRGWSQVGECEHNPAWMLPNCPLSCALC